MSNFKKCPFCGGEAYLKSSEPSTANHNEGAVHFGVACGEFQCEVLPVSNLWQCTPEDAIKAWNNRPYESELKRKAVWDIINHADELAKDKDEWIRIVGRSALELERESK